MIGNMLRFMRFKKGLKQTELAEALNIGASTLAHYESEYRSVTLEMANEIAEACDFELVFISKGNKKKYKFDDVKRLSYDVRVRDGKKVKMTIKN